MAELNLQRENLETRLDKMGVMLSEDSRSLLNMRQHSPDIGCAKLESNFGQTRGVKVGHLMAFQVIKDILSAGYCVTGTYTTSDSNQKIDEAREKYGADNVHVLSISELSQLNESDLDNNFSYVFVKGKLAGEECISFKEILIRMFVQSN